MNDPENQSKAIADPGDNEPVLQNDRIVLILCGLIASGKSTFAKALETHLPQFRRCCQDELGSRKKVEEVAREYLGLGYSICVDRTNVDTMQRSHWIKIAREFPGTLIWVIVFDTPYEVCAERLQKRTSHPTIKSAQQGLSILARFANAFHHPAPHEGYDRILYLQPPCSPSNPQELVSIRDLGSRETGPEDLAFYTKAEITSILHRVQNSPVTLSSNSTSFSSILAASPGITASTTGTHWRRPRNMPFFPHPPRSSPLIPVQYPGTGQDQGNSRNNAVGYNPLRPRSLRSEARSGGGGQTSAGTTPSTTTHVLPQGFGAGPGESGSGRVGPNTSYDGDKLREEQQLR